MLRHSRGLPGLRAGLHRILACCGLALLFSASPSFAQSTTGLKKTTQATSTIHASQPTSVAQQTQLEGELEVLHEDDFKNKKSRTRHFLKTDKGERYELKFKAHAPHHPTGTKLRVKGAKSGNVLYLDSSGGSNVQVLAMASTNTFGEQKVAVMLVNFTDNTTQPFTSSQANAAFFGSTGSATSFYKENSFGNTWLSGNVLGWYTLPISSTSDAITIASHAKQAAQAAGVDLTAYSRYVYVFPKHPTYPWSGSATVGGAPSEAWLNGTIAVKTISHELGHNLGLDHAKYMNCGTVSLGSNCGINAYGDPSDSMGAISTGHFDAFHKEQLGWLNNGAMPPITTVSSDGTYSLDPYEIAGSKSKALKILKGVDATTGAKTWYYIEYRQPVGFDTALPTLMYNNNLTRGVQVRLGTDGDIGSSYLLDMTPGSEVGQYDSALVPGQSYSDSTAGIVVTTLSADTTGATVNVSFASKPTQSCVQTNPSVLVSTSQNTSVAAGTSVTYTVAVTNNDSSACSASTFNLLASVPSGWGASFGSSALTVSPGSAGSTTFTVTSSSTALVSSYTIGATATNTSYSASGSATYSVASTTTTTTSGKGGGKGRVK
ncbi:NEW3 domain-containing protein [Pseudogulbenkiania sp. MAI-1]|uniref:NEW3 domain-containing protein n=1 Tax=Pseudogulbenkiania sp. MAI-1 TaxID=990370 RepID=UPI00045E6EF7|nr:NEW3 domain-containing protein [Pseudogulbenkiania sp. MAI-1]